MKILIIKLGAMGDVLRTTPLLTALKNKYAGCRITWLVDRGSIEVLQGNPLIDYLMALSAQNLAELEKQNFDLAVNLDKDKEALDAMTLAPARKKAGFGRLPGGSLSALDAKSDYAYRLGIDDDLKFRKNRKTYQEISFEQLGLAFKGEEYIFPLDEPSIAYARDHLKALGVNLGSKRRPIVGLNTGSGSRFAGKKLPVTGYVDLAKKFYDQMKAEVLLLGGEEEIERNKEIEKRAERRVINTGSYPIKRFAAIVRECDVVISGDTIAMHVAIAMKVPVVAFFASTCAAEIELYGRGKKVVSTISCAPCYLKDCPFDEQCMKDIKPDMLFDAARETLKRTSIS